MVNAQNASLVIRYSVTNALHVMMLIDYNDLALELVIVHPARLVTLYLITHVLHVLMLTD